MSKYKVLLWDIDQTILNFLVAEKNAVRSCFESHNLGICTDEMLCEYSSINKKYWKKLELGEINKSEVLEGRFREFFTNHDIDTSIVKSFNNEYQIRLGDTIVFNDNAYELLKELSNSFRQYAITNGTLIAQSKKLRLSGLDKIFIHSYISDEIGFEKPSHDFFDYVLSDIGSYEKKEVLVIGDSLTSDIKGANNVGLPCCWYNPGRQPKSSNIFIDYQISNLNELKDILNV